MFLKCFFFFLRSSFNFSYKRVFVSLFSRTFFLNFFRTQYQIFRFAITFHYEIFFSFLYALRFAHNFRLAQITSLRAAQTFRLCEISVCKAEEKVV